MDVTETKKWVVDTNILLDHVDSIALDGTVVLMSTVKQELDKLKTVDNEELKYKARRANRFIFENFNKFIHDVIEYDSEEILGVYFNNEIKDNRIVSCAKANGYGVITNDLNLFSTAKSFGLEVDSIREEIGDYEPEESYTGFKEVYMTEYEHQDFYNNELYDNKFDLLVNQYLIIKDDLTGETVDALKWNGECHLKVKAKSINSTKLGKYTARDIYQSIAMDALQSNKIKMLSGKAGTAKTLFALSYAMNQIEKGKYSKLIVFANSLPTRNAAQLGLYKGSLKEKLMQVSVGHILASKFGDYNEVEAMMTTGELLILPMSDMRGFDTTGMNACVLITEAQNTDKDLMKLAVERVGEDSTLIIEGDWKQQLDSKSFEGKNNGMVRLSEVFRGDQDYGEVELQNIYRSRWAAKAQEM